MKYAKGFILALFLILLMLIAGCKSSKTDVKKAVEDIRKGTDGLVLSFFPNAPPEKIHVEEGKDNPFEVILEVRNKGAYPQPEEGVAPTGKIFLGGYDKNILTFAAFPAADLDKRPLDGKSTINLNGGLDLVIFKGQINIGNLNVERYEPTIQATACYEYRTIAEPLVCIDPTPFSTVKERKVCSVQDTSLSNQGAPIAVTKIEEEAFSSKTQFRITIKNVGNGDAVRLNSLENCKPSKRLTRDDLDKVYLFGVTVGTKPLTCRPFISAEGNVITGESGHIRLINGEGYVICDLLSSEYSDPNTAYQTPLKIVVDYVYRNSIQKKIQIKKEMGSLGGVTPRQPYNIESKPNYPSEPSPIFPEGISYT